MDAPRQAYLYWARLPDEPRAKRRPVLVLSLDVRNRLASDIIVAPVSTRLRDAPTHVALHAKEGGLPQRSVVKCEQVTTILKERLVSPPIGGPLSPRRMDEIHRGILRALGVPID